VPQIRKLAPEEVKGIKDKGKSSRKLVEEQYDGFLADFAVGDYGDVLPDEGESRLTVRNRLKAAAKRRGVELTFIRTSGDAMRFRVETNGNGAASAEEAPEPAPEPAQEVEEPPVSSDVPPTPPKRRGGRPRKNPQP